eukprot:6981051-Prymnesium_polylepis.1
MLRAPTIGWTLSYRARATALLASGTLFVTAASHLLNLRSNDQTFKGTQRVEVSAALGAAQTSAMHIWLVATNNPPVTPNAAFADYSGWFPLVGTSSDSGVVLERLRGVLYPDCTGRGRQCCAGCCAVQCTYHTSHTECSHLPASLDVQRLLPVPV